MIVFHDTYRNEVSLSFSKNPFSNKPKHVWVICRYGENWLLTNHKDRGLEFPGGKVEKGETPEEAAIREIKEETGGEVKCLHYIGQYKVVGKEKTLIKNIYFAEISKLNEQESYFETMGPVQLESIPPHIKRDKNFSFIMKDAVLTHTLKEVTKYIQNKELS
ncbi:nucleoside triphosphatase YtkD [Bacillus timonensis]|nr:nucleoside triphosphatase YtkD [Bacillus timonensis]